MLVLSIIEARNSSPDKLANKQLQNYHLNSRSGRFGIAATSAAKYTNRIYIETWRVVAFQNMRSTTAQTAVLYVEIACKKTAAKHPIILTLSGIKGFALRSPFVGSIVVKTLVSPLK